MTARVIVRAVGAAMAGIASVLAGTAEAAEPSPALQAVIDAAKKEGRLDLQWGDEALGGSTGAAEFAKGMNTFYGTNIAVRFTPGAAVPQVANSVVLAFDAHQPSPTDAFLGTTEHIGALAPKKVLQPVDWVSLMPGRIDSSFVEVDGAAVRVYTTLPGGIVYNTKLAPMKPTKLTDLLKPEWKGKIATSIYSSGFDMLGVTWGEEKALDFARQLTQQVSGLIRCPEIARVASGEFLAFGPDCNGRVWPQLQRKGAPIAYAEASELAIFRYYYLSVPVHSAHPNAAKLFVSYVLTPQGQDVLWRTMDLDEHQFPDSKMRGVIEGYQKDGLTFREFTVDTWLTHPEGGKTQHEANQIVTRH